MQVELSFVVVFSCCPRFLSRLYSESFSFHRCTWRPTENPRYPPASSTPLEKSLRYPSTSKNPVSSFVLDAEVVAFNRETKQFVPFQVLSARKRTKESAESAKVHVTVQEFYLMYLNGKSLLDKTLTERRELMKNNFLPMDCRLLMLDVLLGILFESDLVLHWFCICVTWSMV